MATQVSTKLQGRSKCHVLG